MFKRNWIIAVAFGLMGLGSLHPQDAWGQSTAENEPRQEESTTDPDNTGNDQGQQPENLAPSLEGIEAAIRDLVAEEDKIATQAQQDRENRDLRAQESMARWAMWMFYATAATVMLTFAALIAIIRTLHHTRRAADYTRDMLTEAKRSASAAEDAVSTTRDVGEKQVRAYLKVKSLSVTVGPTAGKIGASIEIANSGQSPAIGVSARVRIEAKHNLQGVLEIPMPDISANSTEMRDTKPTNVEEGVADLVGATIINANAVVTAKDVFGGDIEAVAMRILSVPQGAKATKTYDLGVADGIFPPEAVKFMNSGMGRASKAKKKS